MMDGLFDFINFIIGVAFFMAIYGIGFRNGVSSTGKKKKKYQYMDRF